MSGLRVIMGLRVETRELVNKEWRGHSFGGTSDITGTTPPNSKKQKRLEWILS